MGGTPLIKQCRCGADMQPTKQGSPVSICPNCDAVQDCEKTKDGSRKPTHEDRRYLLSWASIQRGVYTVTRWPDGTPFRG